VSQQVSVSGSATACDAGCQLFYGIQHDGQSFSSAKQNTTLPTTNIFQDGSANDSFLLDPSNPFSGRGATIDASASQTSDLTSTNLNVGLFVLADFSGSSDLMFGNADATSQYSLVFDLTNPYVVHLTGDIVGESLSRSPLGGPGGSFDGEIHLSGPGLQFDQVLTFPMDSSGNQPFDQFLTLGPGQYTLNVISGLNGEQSDILNATSSLSSDLNADFTPAIPEPAQVSTFLGLLIVVGLFFCRRHAAPASESEPLADLLRS
jgi:hypothetical protein